MRIALDPCVQITKEEHCNPQQRDELNTDEDKETTSLLCDCALSMHSMINLIDATYSKRLNETDSIGTLMLCFLIIIK